MSRIPTKLSIIISTVVHVVQAALFFITGILLFLIMGITDVRNVGYRFLLSIFSEEQLTALTLHSGIPVAAAAVWIGFAVAVMCICRLGRLYNSAGRPMDFFCEKGGQRAVYYVYTALYITDVLVGAITALSVNGGLGRAANLLCVFILIGTAVIATGAVVMIFDARNACVRFKALSPAEQAKVCEVSGKKALKKRAKEQEKMAKKARKREERALRKEIRKP